MSIANTELLVLMDTGPAPFPRCYCVRASLQLQHWLVRKQEKLH